MPPKLRRLRPVLGAGPGIALASVFTPFVVVPLSFPFAILDGGDDGLSDMLSEVGNGFGSWLGRFWLLQFWL